MDVQKAATLIYAELIGWLHQAARLVPKLAIALLLLLLFTALSR